MTANADNRKRIPLAEAAARQGTTALNILMQIRRGRLVGEEIDGTWYVSALSLAATASEAQAPDAVPMCQGQCRGCGAGH